DHGRGCRGRCPRARPLHPEFRTEESRVTPDLALTLAAHVDQHHQAAAAFLAELVKVPSDNPPGDCASHGARAAALLEVTGFAVQRDPVPADAVAPNGMNSPTNLIVRHRFGPGPVIALNAHGDVVAPGEGWSSDPY